MKKVESIKKKTKVVKPIIVEEMTTLKKAARPVYREKAEYNSIPPGHIRAIVLRNHNGMVEFHAVGDIVDLPERRFKSLLMRGLVKEYVGDKLPNKQR